MNGFSRKILALAAVTAAALCPLWGQQAHVTLRANVAPLGVVHDDYADTWGYTDPTSGTNYALLTSDDSDGVWIYDISTTPGTPILAGHYCGGSGDCFPGASLNLNTQNMEDAEVAIIGGKPIGFFASNGGAGAGPHTGLHVVDLSDPTQPTLIRQISTPELGFDHVHNFRVDTQYLYIPHYVSCGDPNCSSGSDDQGITEIEIFDVNAAVTPPPAPLAALVTLNPYTSPTNPSSLTRPTAFTP